MNEQDQSKQIPSAHNLAACASRQSGKAVIKDVIHRLRARASQLQTLVDMLPENPTPEQDQALWSIAVELERR